MLFRITKDTDPKLRRKCEDVPLPLSEENQKRGIEAGINSLLVGNYLTTTGSKSEDDKKMLEELDLTLSK